MEEKDIRAVAAQLRKPEGDMGRQVGLKMNEGNKLMNLYTLELVAATPNETILEIGMGNGLFVKEIVSQHPSVRYIGCDFSETMIEEASHINREWINSGQAKFFLTSADTMPVKDHSVDKVFTINTIYFWEPASDVFREIRRILKSTGKLFIAVRPKAIMENIPFTKYGFNFFSKDDLVKELSDNGFTVIDVVEREEPPQEIAGTNLVLTTLVVCAEVKP